MKKEQLLLVMVGIFLSGQAYANQASTEGAVVYKGTDSKGRVIYTNNPKGVSNAQRIKLDPTVIQSVSTPNAMGANAGGALSGPLPPMNMGPLPQGLPPLPSDLPRALPPNIPTPVPVAPASQDRGPTAEQVQKAQERLEMAQQALQKGTEPLPGERTGLAGGGSRLNEAYFTRIKNLQNEVNDAQKELNALLGR